MLAQIKARQLAVAKLFVEALVARQKARIEQADVEFRVVGSEAGTFRGGAHGVGNSELGVPKLRQQLRGLLRVGGCLPGPFDQQQQVNVGMGKQLGPAVAAHRNEGHPGAFRVKEGGGKVAGDRLIGCSRARGHIPQAIAVGEEVCPKVIERLRFRCRRIRHGKAGLEPGTAKSKTSESGKEDRQVAVPGSLAKYLD